MRFFVRDRKGSTKQKALLIMISIMALVVQPMYGLIASYIANAAPSNVVVAPTSLHGWERSTPDEGYADAKTKFVTDSTAPLGVGALQFDSSASNEYTTWTYEVADKNVNASDINLHYSTKRLAGPVHAAPSFIMVIDKDGDFTTADGFYAIYEPAYNGGSNYNSWNTWSITSDSKLWYSAAYGPKPAEAVNYTPFSQLLNYYPNAKIQTIGLNFGTGNNDWSVMADNIKSVDGTIFDFEPATIASCPATTNIHIATLSGWDLSQTRATGHNQITADGLRVWTESNTSTDKAAGYYPVNFDLRNLGSNTNSILTLTTNSGSTQPGGQLKIDFNNDGTVDGILVGEPTANGYGNNWWLNNAAEAFVKAGAPNNGGGYGSPWYGDANEWLNAFPTAKVKAIGYSLGSGVQGDYTITKITAGCVNYTFGIIAPTLTVTTPAEGQKVSTKLNGDKLRIEGVFKDDIKANYATMQLVRNGSSVAIGTLYGYGSVYNPAATYADINGNYVFDLPVPANLADGEYSLFYVGTDFEGGITSRMERKFLIDNTAPNTPNNLRLQVRSTGNFVGQNGWTNHSDVTALWNDNNTEAVTYEYQYWNDVTTSSWKSDNRWKTNSATASYAGTVNEGEGKHYYCVVAIDLAGNRSNCSAAFSFNYDATNPVTDIVVGSVANGKFTVSGDASDNLSLNRVYVQLVHRETGVRYGGTTLNLIGKGQAADWSVEYKTSDLPQGTYAAHVEVVDMAGNRGTAGWTEKFFVDRTAPVVTVDSIANSTATTRTITGTVADNNVVTGVEVSIDGGLTWQPASTFDGTNWTFEATGLAIATHTVVARATDEAGNTSSDDTSSPADYWTTFTVTGNTGTGSNGVSQTSTNQFAAPDSTNASVLNANNNGDATTDTTPTTDEATDTDVLAATTTDSNKDGDTDGQVLAAEDTKGNWSVVNLVLAVVTIILSLGALLGLARKKDGTAARIMTLIPVAIAVTAFLMIENWTASMIWLNWWTVLYAVVLAVQVAIVSGLKNSAE